MMRKLIEFARSRRESFEYAFAGWRYALRTQRNAWIHAVVSLCVLSISFWLGLNARDWAVILLTIATVWAAEFFNTALEAVVDLASQNQWNAMAKICKDVGAAAVLVTAVASFLVGLLILGPPLMGKLKIP